MVQLFLEEITMEVKNNMKTWLLAIVALTLVVAFVVLSFMVNQDEWFKSEPPKTDDVENVAPKILVEPEPKSDEKDEYPLGKTLDGSIGDETGAITIHHSVVKRGKLFVYSFDIENSYERDKRFSWDVINTLAGVNVVWDLKAKSSIHFSASSEVEPVATAGMFAVYHDASIINKVEWDKHLANHSMKFNAVPNSVLIESVQVGPLPASLTVNINKK